MTQRNQIDFLDQLEVGSTVDDDDTAQFVNLLHGQAAWKLACAGVSNPTIERVDIPAPDGTNCGLRVFYPGVSETSQFSVLYQHPAQAPNTKHRFTVYLRGEAEGGVVWLSHSPAPVAFSRQKCILSSEWKDFTLEYRTSRSGEQYIHIGIDLRDGEQTARPAQRIFVWGATLCQIEYAPPRIVPTTASNDDHVITIQDVISNGGAWLAAADGARFKQLRGSDGEPLAQAIREAWSPGELITLRHELAILLVRRDDGLQQSWLFDRDLRLRAQTLRPGTHPDETVPAGGFEARTVALTFRAAFMALLCDARTAGDDPLVQALMQFGLGVRCDLSVLGWSAIDAPRLMAPPAATLGVLSDQEVRVNSILSLDWLEVTQQALETGQLTIPALSHDGSASSALVIVTDAYRAAIQVQDTPGAEPWIILLDVFTLQHRYYDQAIQALVFPRNWTFIPGREHDPVRVAHWLGTVVFRLIQLGGDIRDWARNSTEIAILGRPPYWQAMGHQIWNTNSTLLRAVEAANRRNTQPPEYWDIAAAGGIEIFGPIEDFFPELRGRVRRSVPHTEAAFVAAAREGKTLLFDVFHEVPTRLRARMLQAVAADPTIQALYRDRFPSVMKRRSRRLPVVALGLRLQNRTVPELLDLFVAISETLAKRGPLVVILDGLTTSSGGSVFKTYSVNQDDQDLLAREQAFADEYRKRVKSLPITLLNTIGTPIRETLFWLGFADIFVSPHGTGVTKYRWFHNTPGLILASEQNVRFGYALRIYEADGNVEEPSELLYTNPEEVNDLLPVNQKFDQAGRMNNPWWLGLVNHNFEIKDPPVLIDRIAALFDRCVVRRPRPGEEWLAQLRVASQEFKQ